MVEPSAVQEMLLMHGRHMLVSEGTLLSLLHGPTLESGPIILGIVDPRNAEDAVQLAFGMGAMFVCVLHDGYVTDLQAVGWPACVACGGVGCAGCHQTGRQRQDALVIRTYWPGQRTSETIYQRYRKIEDGSYLFEPAATTQGQRKETIH